MSQMKVTFSSNKIMRTNVPASEPEPRKFWLRNWDELPPPWIAYSHFVPSALVVDLMREKRDVAHATKFILDNRPADRITNMEGAMHTFVTPVVEAGVVGDYQYRNGHDIHTFGKSEGKWRGRLVLMSALVQQDYEDPHVMVRVVSCKEGVSWRGNPDYPVMLHWTAKQNDAVRRAYNDRVHSYLVYHLTESHRLPSAETVKSTAFNVPEAIKFLEDTINNQSSAQLVSHMRDRFMSSKGKIMSLEMMWKTAVWQMKNEFVLLGKLASEQGYVYTFSPPVIFVRFFDSGFSATGSKGTALLSRLHILAIKYLKRVMVFKGLKYIAWGDFNDSSVVSLLKRALDGQDFTKGIAQRDIFCGNKDGGLYVAPPGAERSVLVIHNNSDAFGQNIETEPSGGSLDGVIGTYSSAAGSLLRSRKDLCDNLIKIL